MHQLNVTIVRESLYVALVLSAAGCSSPHSPDLTIPEWADGTDWTGTVIMQTGTTFDVSLRLEADDSGTIFGDPGVNVYVSASSFRDRTSGLELKGGGYGDAREKTIWVVFPRHSENSSDGVTGKCTTPTPAFPDIPHYRVDATLTSSTEFTGTVTLRCRDTNVVFESQALVLRRI